MKQVEIAKFFNVSRATVADWKRRGCPVAGDLAAIAEWKTARELEHAGIEGSRLPALVAEHVRRREDLTRRIKLVNAWPPGTDANPNLVKAAVVSSLILEQELLNLPHRVIAESKPATLPQDIFRIVFEVLDREKRDPEEVPR